MAKYWLPADGEFVLRLIRLRVQLAELGADAPLGMYAATLALERTLFLTPGARRERLKAAVAEPPPAPARVESRGRGQRPPPGGSARERERLLRG